MYIKSFVCFVLLGGMCASARERKRGESITPWGLVTPQSFLRHLSLLGFETCTHTCLASFSSHWVQDINCVVIHMRSSFLNLQTMKPVPQRFYYSRVIQIRNSNVKIGANFVKQVFYFCHRYVRSFGQDFLYLSNFLFPFFLNGTMYSIHDYINAQCLNQATLILAKPNTAQSFYFIFIVRIL